MRLRAMAKINLGLDVIRRRDDGYHEVRMIMQTIKMYDVLDIRKKKTQGISPCYQHCHMCLLMRKIWFIKRRSFLWMNLI